MVTYTSCVKYIRKQRHDGHSNTLFIAHTSGYVDRRGIDRGFTVADPADIIGQFAWDIIAVADSNGHITRLSRSV